MKRLPLLLFLLLALPAVAFRDAALAAPPADDLVRQAIRRHDIQTEMPAAEPARSGWPDWTRFVLSRDTLRIVLWGAVILGVGVTIWSLRDSLPAFSRSRRIKAEPMRAASPDPSARMDEAQLEADDLAGRGHYGEAMHVLLLKSLAEIRLRLGTSFAVSLTSREILRRVSLPQAGAVALGAIVRSVEQTHFGGRPAGREDYLGCRQEFETLKRSMTAGAA